LRVLPSAQQNEALAVLRHTVVGCVEHAPGKPNAVTRPVEGSDEFIEKLLLVANSEAFDVLKNKRTSPQFLDNADELEHEFVARVIEYAMAHKRKSLTRRPAKNAVYLTRANSSYSTDCLSSYPLY
jgi:hypothetical protein